jgi:hypothetical protein
MAFFCPKDGVHLIQKGVIEDATSTAARRNYPCYLNEIAHCEQGSTPQERVARNLIGHLRSHEEFDPILHLRVFALEIEFATLQRKDAARAH